MTYLGKFNKLLRRICQLETNKYYSNAQILDQFIAGLKDKLIKKVHPHAPEDLATAIQQAKNYEMAIEEANCTKFVNLVIGETSSAAEEKIDQLTKKVENYFTNQQQQQQLQPQYPNYYYQSALQPIQQQYQQPFTPQYQVPARKLIQHNQFTPQNRFSTNNNRFNSNNQLTTQNSNQHRPTPYHTQPNIFPFEFEANESPSLLNNVAVNKQKAITAMYTEAEVEKKPIRLILDSGSTRSIITYQLMQQLQQTVDRPAQTVIITADGMKKTPVGEINNFLFTIDGITISVKVLANANLDWETQELKISYQGQHTIVSATCGTFKKQSKKAPVLEFEEKKEMPLTETYMALGSTSNWAKKTEQKFFEESRRWKKVRYSIPEPQKQSPYIPLKCRNCNKKLSSMGACILPKEEYENHTCYYYMLPEECNWINVAIRGGVCDQTCQYALSISEKIKRRTPFDAAYNSVLNKLYHYPHDAEMIFDLAMTLVNRATKEDVCQIKEAEYIEYTIELAGFDYENEQMNIRLCEECIMSCDEQWCPECYAFSIPLPIKDDQHEIEFGIQDEKVPITLIYLTENQPVIIFKYFNNKRQEIKPEKAHEIDAGYDLRYPEKNTLILQPKSFTKINLKIVLEIPPGTMVQITF
ncbi:hypothetical protein G9A89_023333 [Geosiphon pyriformis]|nr:hypothetical protein G9A89_023333 [Geosiphon pyriformis]